MNALCCTHIRWSLEASSLSVQDGEAEEKANDPGAAVALGAALLVRLLVPVWVVNATLLPISAIVLPHIRPPTPKTPPPQVRTSQSSPTSSTCPYCRQSPGHEQSAYYIV